MQIDPASATQAVHVYQELKFWLPVATAVGLLWKVFQGVSWLKGLKTEVLDVKTQLAAQSVTLQSQIAQQTSTLQSQIAQQTNAIVDELKEIRQDFRLVMAPPPRLVRARSSKKSIATAESDSL